MRCLTWSAALKSPARLQAQVVWHLFSHRNHVPRASRGPVCCHEARPTIVPRLMAGAQHVRECRIGSGWLTRHTTRGDQCLIPAAGSSQCSALIIIMKIKCSNKEVAHETASGCGMEENMACAACHCPLLERALSAVLNITVLGSMPSLFALSSTATACI